MAAVRLLLLLLFFLSPLSLSVSDTEALLKLKKWLSHTNPLNSWKQNTSPCNNDDPWAGVMCNDGVMTGLHLAEMGLSGTIDIDALLELSTLRTLTLVNNSFSGPLPDFNRIGALKALYLSFNNFSGEIPSDYFVKMGSLKKVWLSGNKFSGKIPNSLTQIPHLMELRLENNEFSGPIPNLGQKSLNSLDLSNNKLEGEIPMSLWRFDLRSFQENPGLCGKPLGNDCSKSATLDSLTALQPGQVPKQAKKAMMGWVVIGIIASVLILTVLLRSRKSKDRFHKLGKENLDEVVEVHINSSNRRNVDPSQSQKGGSTRRGSQHRRGMGDLVMVNEERGTFGLADLMKAAAEVLGNGGLGSAYKAVMGNGVSVVVKRMREMNKISRDSFDTEMRRLGKLRHPNILTPLAYHYRKDEKLLVSEHVSKGSLLYILHGDRGISHDELNWPIRLKIIKGVARGMGFLHSEFASYELPHGNLKSSNILLDENFEPLLSDYAFYPLINSTQAVQAMFAYKSPEAILYQQVTPKSDVYCFGIIILEILTGKFPAQYLSNQKGGTDVVQWVQSAVSEKRERELIDPEIARSTMSSLEAMEELLHIGADCTESNLDERINMKEAIRRIEEIQV
ncbi:leucine-rich repeat protein kinase family protein [Actinidia rufa]|uniref:Leucine-rich repeat protein kinase family protein n=1 Tax=Actinidia rufa TaxID=165716 RepID=A0A7J0FKU6_9ERIC|nr:leucine-rich repeat protein kinase family protein [Actinidia rufa]